MRLIYARYGDFTALTFATSAFANLFTYADATGRGTNRPFTEIMRPRCRDKLFFRITAIAYAHLLTVIYTIRHVLGLPLSKAVLARLVSIVTSAKGEKQNQNRKKQEKLPFHNKVLRLKTQNYHYFTTFSFFCQYRISNTNATQM